MQDYHAEFVEIYNKNITRPGADRLLNWLETTDFFTAPASTRFHGACECGLVMHSINVYNAMMQHFFTEGESAESYAICEVKIALLGNLCRIGAGFRYHGEQLVHLVCGLDVEFISLELHAVGILNGLAGLDAQQDALHLGVLFA